jgi:hypothetical protein
MCQPGNRPMTRTVARQRVNAAALPQWVAPQLTQLVDAARPTVTDGSTKSNTTASRTGSAAFGMPTFPNRPRASPPGALDPIRRCYRQIFASASGSLMSRCCPKCSPGSPGARWDGIC